MEIYCDNCGASLVTVFGEIEDGATWECPCGARVIVSAGDDVYINTYVNGEVA